MRLLLLLLLLFAAAANAQEPQVKQCIAKHPPGGARAQCVTPWLDDLVQQKSVARALEAAEDLVRRGLMNVNDCHIMGHAIGHSSWRKEKDLSGAFNACTMACIQGCMHGAVEAFMIDGPPAQTTPARVRVFCDSLKDPVRRRQCLHGLGHGITYEFRKDVKGAANACETVGGRREADLCLGGLWMQWSHFRIHLGAEAYAKGAAAMCDGLGDGHLSGCARQVGGGAMFAAGHDPVKAGEICKLLPQNQRSDCQRGVDYEVKMIKGGLKEAHHHHH
jgi:hypothetical protein